MQGFVIIALVAAGRVGTVELNYLNSGKRDFTDVLLGQVLANELGLVPSAKTAADAEQISASSGTMFTRPERVIVALIEGAEAQGAGLDSDCTPAKECVGETCYATTAPCVAQRLVTQSRTNLAADAKATVGVASEPLRGAASGATSLVQVGELASQAAALTPIADVQLAENRATVRVGDSTASLDTRDLCVQTLLAEAAAVATTVPKKLTLLMPRSGACMQAKFGKDSAEAKVATQLLERAVRSHDASGVLTATVRLVAPEGALPQDLLVPEPHASLVQQSRRLASPQAAAVAMAAAVTNYHVYAWTTLTIALSLIAAVYSIVAMTNERDPLLYAKYRPEVDPTRRG